MNPFLSSSLKYSCCKKGFSRIYRAIEIKQSATTALMNTRYWKLGNKNIFQSIADEDEAEVLAWCREKMFGYESHVKIGSSLKEKCNEEKVSRYSFWFEYGTVIILYENI